MSPRLRPSCSVFVCVCALAWAWTARGAGGAASLSHPPSEYTVREWHEHEGLPSDELAAVVQDAEGFLWVASNGEMARFDGGTFETIAPPQGGFLRGMITAAGGPHGASITLLIPGTRDTAERKAGWYVLRGDSFDFEQENALTGKLPRSIFDAPDGARWIGCDDGTLLRRMGRETTLLEPPEDLSGKKIPVFATDAEGQLWVSRGNRLHRLEGAGCIDVPFDQPQPEIRIGSSRSGGIWVFTRTALLRWDGSALNEIIPLPELLGAHFVQAIHEDRNGHLWIGTRSQGLFRIHGREILHVPTSGEEITSICEDGDGGIWAATNGAGLNRLRAKAHQLLDQSSGLTDNFSYTVAGDATGALWLANRDGGVARIQDGTVDPISRRAGWRSFSAKSVHPSPDGRVWITSGLGVFRTDAMTPETVTREVSLNAFRNVRSTFVARNGDYWLAADPDRVARWRDGQVTTFGHEEGLDGREIRAFAEDDTGRIWLGAADGRLFRSVGEKFERVSFPYDYDCGALQVIRFEADGTVMIGTTRRGVLVFPRGDFPAPRLLDAAHGLADGNISQILVDDFDRYWFASRRGIFWVHGRHVRDFTSGISDHVHAIALGRDDGLPFLSCLGLYQPAAWKAGDGTLWFATRRGVLRTDPSVMPGAHESPPSVAIASIICDGRRQEQGGVVRIRSGVRKTQIHLSALDLSAPESVQVRYRLDGFDDDWVILGRDRMVTYPRLPPGRYTLDTMASNGTGSWNQRTDLLTILVRPPWWQSRWAQAAWLLILLALVSATVRRWSHRRLRLHLERSEQARAVERERTRIAQNIHDDLGATLTRISLLTQSAQQESGAHSPTLEKIYHATHAITRSMDEIVWAVNPRHDNTESLVYYLGNFAQNFLGSAGIRCRLESPGALPEASLTSQIRHNLFLCCKEALNNVVKHAGATEASVRVAFDRTTLTIAISDNGSGIHNSPTAVRDPLRASSGNGLRNLEQRMSEIRGTCTVRPGSVSGTVVSFTVPLRTDKADRTDY